MNVSLESRARCSASDLERASQTAWLKAMLDALRSQSRLLVLSMPAPVAPIESLLKSGLYDTGVFWMPPRGLAVAGIGEAARITLSGTDRMHTLLEASHQLLRSALCCSAPGVDAPPPRLYGGLAFEVGSAAQQPWTHFGDGHFVLPRWSYCQNGGRPWLTLTVQGGTTLRREKSLALLEEFDVLWWHLEQAGSRRPSLHSPENGHSPLNQDLHRSELEGFPSPDRPHAPHAACLQTPATTQLIQQSEAHWGQQVEAVRAAIQRGEFAKIVVARRCEITRAKAIDPFVVLTRLVEDFPTCTRFAFTLEQATFLGATPERLISRRSQHIETEALAGSIRVGQGEAARLLTSSKDLEEHLLVVDEVLAALRPLCTRLERPDQPEIRQLRDILHLRTPIAGELERPTHVLELVQALHPTPAVGGVPTGPAVQWITRHEPEPRGWYAGPVGWFDASGDGDFAVALRSGLIQGTQAWIYAGAGIVKDSNPSLEYAETALKQRALLRALEAEP